MCINLKWGFLWCLRHRPLLTVRPGVRKPLRLTVKWRLALTKEQMCWGKCTIKEDSSKDVSLQVEGIRPYAMRYVMGFSRAHILPLWVHLGMCVQLKSVMDVRKDTSHLRLSLVRTVEQEGRGKRIISLLLSVPQQSEVLFLTGGWACLSEYFNMCQNPGGEKHNVIIPVKHCPRNANNFLWWAVLVRGVHVCRTRRNNRRNETDGTMGFLF